MTWKMYSKHFHYFAKRVLLPCVRMNNACIPLLFVNDYQSRQSP